MSTLLPVGTYVRVAERIPNAAPFVQSDLAAIGADGPGQTQTYVGKVVGYDIGHSKCELGMRYGGWGGWLFCDGGTWVFPRQVEEISEAEALQVEVDS